MEIFARIIKSNNGLFSVKRNDKFKTGKKGHKTQETRLRTQGVRYKNEDRERIMINNY